MNKRERKLRERLKAAQVELAEVKLDRDQYRRYFQSKFKWFLELHGKGTSPNLEWLIKDMAQLANRVKYFWWS